MCLFVNNCDNKGYCKLKITRVARGNSCLHRVLGESIYLVYGLGLYLVLGLLELLYCDLAMGRKVQVMRYFASNNVKYMKKELSTKLKKIEFLTTKILALSLVLSRYLKVIFKLDSKVQHI